MLRPPGGRGARAVLLRRQYRRHRGGGHRRAGLDFFRAFAERQCGATPPRRARAPPPPSPPRASASPSPTRRRPRLRTTIGRRRLRPPGAARDATTTNPDPVPDPLAPTPAASPSSRRRPRRLRGARRPGFPPEPEPTTLVPPVPEPPVGPSPARSSRSSRRRRPSGHRLAPTSPVSRKIPGLPTAAELLSGKGCEPRVGFFADALVATGLLGLLASPGPFTVFAPSNRAVPRSRLGATKGRVRGSRADGGDAVSRRSGRDVHVRDVFRAKVPTLHRPRRRRERCETRWPRAKPLARVPRAHGRTRG